MPESCLVERTEIERLTADIQRLVAAERERCAKIAEGFKPGFCGDDKDVHRFDLAEAIAAAIRT